MVRFAGCAAAIRNRCRPRLARLSPSTESGSVWSTVITRSGRNGNLPLHPINRQQRYYRPCQRKNQYFSPEKLKFFSLFFIFLFPVSLFSKGFVHFTIISYPCVSFCQGERRREKGLGNRQQAVCHFAPVQATANPLALPSSLRPSTAVRNGICRTSVADTYCSLGCRFAVSRTAGAHLCPSGAVQYGMHCSSFVRAYPSLDFRFAVPATGGAHLRPLGNRQ